MDEIFNLLDTLFKTKVFNNLTLYNLLAIVFKYIFVIIIYYFIFNIIKMIYLDIRGTHQMNYVTNTYLKLINRKEKLPFKVQEHYFIGDYTTLGREDGNDIVIKDRFISKKHLRIVKDEGLFFIEDLGSANGTYLNGERIEDAIELKNKDLIDIGQVEFLFVDGGTNDGK